MFSSVLIELRASKSEFWFQHGRTECRFYPVIFLSHDRRVEAIGYTKHPTTGPGIKPFETEDENAFDLLESMLRYGMQSVVGNSFIPRQRHLIIEIHGDIRSQFKGFTSQIFTQVALQAGAAKVTIKSQ